MVAKKPAVACAVFWLFSCICCFSCGHSHEDSAVRSTEPFAARQSPVAQGDGRRGRYKIVFDEQSRFSRVLVLEYPEHVCLVFSDPSEEEQTCLNRNDPSNPAHEYVRYMSVGLAAVENPRRAAMIGLGGGAAVHMMRRAVLHLKLDVIEIDPVVVKAAFLHFGIRESADLDIIESDGRDFIEKTDKKWDLVLLDAFGEDFIPFHLTTVEFLREVKSRLEPDGVVVSNVWRSDKRLFRSMIKTYLGVFDRVFVFPCRLTGNAVVMGATGKAAKSCEAIAEQAARLNRKIDFPFDFQEAPSRCEEGGAIDVSGVPILLDERPEKAQAPGVM